MKQREQIAPPPIQGLDEVKYRGKWLVIAKETGEIVVVGDSLEGARKEATDRGMRNFGFLRVPTVFGHYHVSIK